MIVEESAPANIALIKYMGKSDVRNNWPLNSSLSWTLDDLRTYVRVTANESLAQDQWAPLKGDKLLPIQLSEKAVERYLNHFRQLKSLWGIEKNFLIESANNFPSDCGLASSASSFAALTKAAVGAFQQLSYKEDIGMAEMADLSRKGSGSSCRSFFGPWSLWHSEGVRPMEFPISGLSHQVVVVEAKKKSVSSSEAHSRVGSSLLYDGRPRRAEHRLAELILAMDRGEWRSVHDICWAEFWDMHALFETANPPFGYFQISSLKVLQYSRDLWQTHDDGPVVTMDAGANVHFLWRADQEAMAKKVETDLSKEFRVFSSRQLQGSAG